MMIIRKLLLLFRFDLEANRFKEEVSHERSLKDKINREKEKYQSDKYRLEQELEVSSRGDIMGTVTETMLPNTAPLYHDTNPYSNQLL